MLLSIVALLLLFCVVPPRFGMNDNYGIVCLLSGKDGFPATQESLFLSNILTGCLYYLYAINREVDRRQED